MSNATPAPLSVRAYARRRGVSHTAVSKAIDSGRLKLSVVRDERGQPKIADPALADREWTAGTDLSKAPGYVKERASAARAAAPAPRAPGVPRASAPPADAEEEPANLNLAEESAREKFWRANLAELDFRKRSGELVDAKEWEAKLADVFTRIRVRLLGLPTRAKQQLPHLSVTDFGTLDGLVREALEELALELEHEEEREAASG
jgi:phage terminase Nu1 subunit (DNA packaging protein)